MKKGKIFAIFALLIAAVLIIAACGNGDAGTETNGTETNGTETGQNGGANGGGNGGGDTNGEGENGNEVAGPGFEVPTPHPSFVPFLARFPEVTQMTDDILQRGDDGNFLQILVGTTTAGVAFPGVGIWPLTSDAADTNIRGLRSYGLVASGPDNMWTDYGIATFSYDRNGTVTVIMQEEVQWADGVPLTLDDVVFAWELMVHPDNPVGGFTMANFSPLLVGVEEFRDGSADHISGMVLSDNNRRLDIHFTQPLPPGAQFIGGLPFEPVARHHVGPVLAEVGMSYLIEQPVARHEGALGFGPFIVDSVIPGESLFLVANDNYWRGAPRVDGIIYNTIDFPLAPAAMAAGQADFLWHFQLAHFEELEMMAPDNFFLLGAVDAGANILNFRLGYMIQEEEDGPWVVTPRTDDAPIMNVAIRQALRYASNFSEVIDALFSGLGVVAPSILSPFNAADFLLDGLVGNSVFSLQRANEILDAAGFTERDAEGFRLDLNGEPMTLVYAQHLNPTHEVFVPSNLQNWEAIGLRIELWNGDFAEWGYFIDHVFHSNEYLGIDIFAMGWTITGNPQPHGLWARDSRNNMSRHNSPEMQQILDDIVSLEAWDPDFLADAYARWQLYFENNVPAVNLNWPLHLRGANNRLANFSRHRIVDMNDVPRDVGMHPGAWNLVGLTAPTPYVSN